MSINSLLAEHNGLVKETVRLELSLLLEHFKERILEEIDQRGGSLTKEQVISTYKEFSHGQEIFKVHKNKQSNLPSRYQKKSLKLTTIKLDVKDKSCEITTKKGKGNHFKNLKAMCHIVESSDDDEEVKNDNNNANNDNADNADNVNDSTEIPIVPVKINSKNFIEVYFNKENQLIQNGTHTSLTTKYYLDTQSKIIFDFNNTLVGLLKDDILITNI